MLEQITQIIQQIGAQEIAKNGIASDKLGAVTKVTSNSIMDGLKGAVSGGNIDQLTSLFKGGDNVKTVSSNPLVSGMIGNVISQLTGSVGLDKKASEGFAQAAIPMILSTVIGKSKSKDSGFDLSDIMSMLGGSKNAGLMNALGGLLGGDSKKSGGKSKGGNILGDLAKGFFK